jgi:hypothetical protein
MKVTKCDKCGKVYDKAKADMNYSNKDRWGRIAIKLNEDADLCDKCRLACKVELSKGAYDRHRPRRARKVVTDETISK